MLFKVSMLMPAILAEHWLLCKAVRCACMGGAWEGSGKGEGEDGEWDPHKFTPVRESWHIIYKSPAFHMLRFMVTDKSSRMQQSAKLTI